MVYRVLLGWEFGGGNGHIVHLREIASRIAIDQPCEFLFVLQNPAGGRSAGLPNNCVISVPAPGRRVNGNRPQGRETYGEFVAENLMLEEGDFAFRLAGWDKIIRHFKPHLIIADYAPSLSLCARGRWPVLVIGNGYTMPPPEQESFPPVAARNRPQYATDAEIIGRLNKDLAMMGAKTIERLPQLNEADAYGLLTIPLFDPYRATRQQLYLGVEIPGGSPLPKASGSGGIGYFHQESQMNDDLLDGLLDANIETAVNFGPLMRRVSKKFKGSRVRPVSSPFKLVDDMAGKAVAIHHGGLGFATAAVLAGVPQVLLFRHDEHQFTANAIVRAGAGLATDYRIIYPGAIAAAMEHVAASSAMRERALQLAEENAAFRGANPVQAAADIALKFLRAN